MRKTSAIRHPGLQRLPNAAYSIRCTRTPHPAPPDLFGPEVTEIVAFVEKRCESWRKNPHISVAKAVSPILLNLPLNPGGSSITFTISWFNRLKGFRVRVPDENTPQGSQITFRFSGAVSKDLREKLGAFLDKLVKKKKVMTVCRAELTASAGADFLGDIGYHLHDIKDPKPVIAVLKPIIEWLEKA